MVSTSPISVAQLVVEKSVAMFRSLPKSGKPTANQWTVLSAMALVKSDDPSSIHILSLATGTKCLDGSTRLAGIPGSLIHDSHAEVLARRGFLLWLMEEMTLAREGKSSYVTVVEDGKFDLIEGWQIVMMSTHPPCGDATIFMRSECESSDMGSDLVIKDSDEDNADSKEPAAKKVKIDLNRTGAKPVTGCDSLDPGVGYHRLGEVRTKPGRGDRTLSLSCSDKIIKWNMVGLEGALCRYLIHKPLKIHTFVLTGQMFDKIAMERALFGRAGGGVSVNRPALCNVDLSFEFCKSEVRSSPCPDSVLWVNLLGGKGEALTEGHKQGWSRKKLNNPKSWSMLCQRSLAKRFLELVGDGVKELSTTYAELKLGSPNYSLRRAGGTILQFWPAKKISSFSLAAL